MADPPSQPSQAPLRDIGALGLVALHELAHQGNAAARAELERRMRSVSADPSAPTTRTGTPPTAPKKAPAAKPRDAAPPPNAAAQAERLQLMARLAPERDPAGPPRLVGLILIAWGAMLGLGGLTLLAQHGNAYYVFCGLACVTVGILLMWCSPWAAPAHLGLLALAWVWGWRSDGNALGALVSALPLLLPALWLAVPSLRTPLR